MHLKVAKELSYMLLMQASDSLLRVVSVVWLQDELSWWLQDELWGYKMNCGVTR